MKINIANTFKDAVTRDQGQKAREALITWLQEYDALELDFHNVSLSVSFIDECLGILAKEMGKDVFNRRIHIVNASEQTKALLLHVIARRLTTSDKCS